MIYGCCSGDLGNPITLSKRFASFGSANAPDSFNNNTNASNTERQQPPKPKTLGIVTIPIADIMVVDMYGAGDSHRANITTMSFGYFEFTLESRNGQQVLLAFLKASVPKERVMDGQGYGIPRTPSQTSASTRSFDVEAFTASRMAERLESESFSEKLRRRVVKVVSSIEESKFRLPIAIGVCSCASIVDYDWKAYHANYSLLPVSSVISECACVCGREGASPQSTREKRDSPPRNFQYDQVELSLEETEETLDRKNWGRQNSGQINNTNFNTFQRRERMKRCQLPSGLSVEESEPEMESTTGY